MLFLCRICLAYVSFNKFKSQNNLYGNGPEEVILYALYFAFNEVFSNRLVSGVYLKLLYRPVITFSSGLHNLDVPCIYLIEDNFG